MRCLLNNYGEFDEVHTIGPAVWPHFDLICVHKGEVLIRLLKDREVLLTSGQGILIYPDTPFDGYSKVVRTDVSVHHFAFEDNRSSFSHIYTSIAGKRQGFEIFPSYSVPEINREIAGAIALAYQDFSPLLQDMRAATMLLMLAKLKLCVARSRGKVAQASNFEDLIEWLRSRMEESLTLDDMAARMNLSTSHFRALFKTHFGVAPGNFFLGLKMQEAARLLRETWTPIKEIAARFGYIEAPHFHRAFKSYHNITPNKYRLTHLPRG